MSDNEDRRMDATEEGKARNGDRMTPSAAYDLLYYDSGESLASHWIPVTVQYVLTSRRSG